jgi:hypothetical protein
MVFSPQQERIRTEDGVEPIRFGCNSPDLAAGSTGDQETRQNPASDFAAPAYFRLFFVQSLPSILTFEPFLPCLF